ncbi:cbb3-type cytochrome oxidase assembly protein [Brevibacillus ginsengisoli]|uniref:cbb3-type cytochrome oxidase assembly protein n=1 Tax=Brevibacillus ginsengisoli TaxID=363854 RepID=UPI003CF0A069
MTVSGIFLLIIMATFSGSAILIWYWARKDGQFENVEDAKYQMLNDEEEFDQIKQRLQNS